MANVFASTIKDFYFPAISFFKNSTRPPLAMPKKAVAAAGREEDLGEASKMVGKNSSDADKARGVGNPRWVGQRPRRQAFSARVSRRSMQASFVVYARFWGWGRRGGN